MRFADVFLRLGCGLVAWILLLTYALWLAVLNRIGCGPEGDELYRVLLGLAPLAVGAAVLLRVTRPLTEVHSILRYGAVPLLLLAPFGLLSIWNVLDTVWMAKQGICRPDTPVFWEQSWPLVHLLTLTVVCALLLGNWRNAQQSAETDDH